MFSKFLPFFRKAIAVVKAAIVILIKVVQVLEAVEKQFTEGSVNATFATA